MTQTNAVLNLNFDVQDQQTILRVRKQEPPLRVVRAFPIQSASASKLVHQGEKIGLLELGNNELDNQGVGHHFLVEQDNQNQLDSPYPLGLQQESSGQLGYTTSVQPALVHLHNISGGLLGGDQLSLNVVVSAHAQAQLTSTGSTRVYRYRQGYPTTTQTTHLVVEEDGLLEYLPDTLIPYARSQYRQTTRIELAEGAGLFYWEVVTPGREAKGECFEYDLLQIELDISAKNQPIAIERSRLEPARLEAAASGRIGSGLNSLARLGPYRYFATFYICRVGVEAEIWHQLEAQLDEEARKLSVSGQTLWGVSTLPAHGLSVRAVGSSCHSIQRTLPIFWQMAKEELYQQDAVMPRKVY
ncbi:MAG: urease accessory protein UreD [Chloroflexota bacterium]